MQAEQLQSDTTTHDLQAYYVLVGDAKEPLTTQFLSPEAIQYLADSSLRDALEFQLYGNENHRSATIPIVNQDGGLRVVHRVLRRPVVYIAAQQQA